MTTTMTTTTTSLFQVMKATKKELIKKLPAPENIVKEGSPTDQLRNPGFHHLRLRRSGLVNMIWPILWKIIRNPWDGSRICLKVLVERICEWARSDDGGPIGDWTKGF